MADPFLDGKPVKLPKNGSDVIVLFCFFSFFYFFHFFFYFIFSFFFFFLLHFITVLATAFCTACRR